MFYRFDVCPVGFIMIEVSEVVPYDRVGGSTKRESRLHLAAQRQRRSQARQRKFDRRRRKPACSPQRKRASRNDAHYRVIAAELNRAVMRDKEVSQTSELRDRVLVVVRDRFITP